MIDQLSGDHPIFIIGAQRSGTTLLRYILSSHPRIYIPPESNFIPRYFGESPDGIIPRERAIRIVEGILKYRMFFKDWVNEKPDAVQFVDSLPSLTPAIILDALYSQYAGLYDSTRWGDKSPIYCDYIDLLESIFPNAQFIHIIRDGRDVALSMVRAYNRPRFFYVDIFYASVVWRQRVENARRSGQSIRPEKYYELHYENLVSNPEEEIKKICNFLGEDFHQDMIAPHSIAKTYYHSKGIHSSTRKPVSTDRVGVWKTSMTDEDQRLFQNIAGDLLVDLGYDLRDLGENSISELFRFIWLRSKFGMIQFGRQFIRSSGIFHPTDILSKFLKPYSKESV
jgi:hypothetical protein